jgi:hypothetical protein
LHTLRFKAFLEETLELWHVPATVESGVAPLVAIIRTEDGATVWIEQALRPERNDHSTHEPPGFRWGVRWRAASAASCGPREVRPRLCGSLVGVLSALREALGVDRGTPLRIAPAPRPASSTDPERSPE